jgi:hypothetical protein
MGMSVKIPLLDIRWQPAVAAALTGLGAFLAWDAIRRARRLLQVTGGPIIVMLANGTLLRARRLLFPAGPDRRLSYARIGTAPGDGPEDFASGRVFLSPSGTLFAVSVTELLDDGSDAVLQVRSADADQSILYGTDNSFVPSTVWNGDDPAAPAWLLAEQALRDADWQTFLEDDPTIPRPIVQGWFADISTDGVCGPAGWTAAGELRVAGQTRPSFRLGEESWWGDGLEPWWAIAGPDATGAWAIRAQGHGAIPATWPAVPQPAPVLAVSVDSTGKLLVDGVVQTSPWLDDDVVAVDGPFS